jgi:PAS domain S-box-containing protein
LRPSESESERLEVVRSYNLLDTEPEAGLDDLTRLASFVFQTPIALISIIDEHRQWFKSRVGLDIQETPRDLAFCAHAITGEGVMVVPDARADTRFATNALVTGQPEIRFYAGAPLKSESGESLGTLCVIDRVPRTLDDRQKEALAAISRQVMTLLELRRSNHQQREFLNAVLDSVHEGIVACDAAGELRLFNRVTREFHGLAEQPLPPEEWAQHYDLYHLDGVTPLERDEIPLYRAFNGEEVENAIMTIAPKGKPRRIISASGRALYDLAGKKLGAVVSMEDISDRQRAEEFLATLSHELKTPMTSILGWSRILQLPDTDDETRIMAARAIEESAMAQSRLVADMLDVSSIIAGKLPLTFDEIDLVAICRRALDAVQPMIDSVGIRLQKNFPADPILIHGDAHRLLQVFWNLISNSTKFTPAGGTIAVTVEAIDGHAAFTVTDSGKGISKEDLPLVFEKFHQASDGRAAGSLGLGLAIVRHIVEAHGGKIEASSEGTGRGATFRVEMPRKVSV